MTHPSMSDPQFERTVIDVTCNYCGARLRLLMSRLRHGNERMLYACPECGKQYEAKAALEPEVLLLHPRSDGKQDRYQESMF